MLSHNNNAAHCCAALCVSNGIGDQYMSPMPPPPGICGADFSFSGFSQMVASVVINNYATDAAFSNATRVTFVGSITPSATRLPYFSVYALKP